ncbi:hypothetical protein BDP27DRAFT_1374773 [Rhodocollybia butyracea]|uniref:Uncharacterized protein n=1 Tax=Rhodocollybia butyracea TaxID=206335 RepID=A0A9P5TX94_9AGAR|nr:hypothetical protein BDP27DRAFT_1374773 [Rhodocollybia butyracea]
MVENNFVIEINGSNLNHMREVKIKKVTSANLLSSNIATRGRFFVSNSAFYTKGIDFGGATEAGDRRFCSCRPIQVLFKNVLDCFVDISHFIIKSVSSTASSYCGTNIALQYGMISDSQNDTSATEETLQNPFVSFEADSGDDDSDLEDENSTGDQHNRVPLIPRSEPSRLDILLDNIQNRTQESLHRTLEFDNAQARQWLEENYGGLIEAPGYKIFSLRCKPGREKTIAGEIQSDIHLQKIPLDVVRAAFPSQKHGTFYIHVRNMNHSNIPLSSYLKRLDATSHYYDVTFNGHGNLELDGLPFHHPSHWGLQPDTWVVPKSGLYRGDPDQIPNNQRTEIGLHLKPPRSLLLEVKGTEMNLKSLSMLVLLAKGKKLSYFTPVHRGTRSSHPHLWKNGTGTTAKIHTQFPQDARTTHVIDTNCDDPLTCEHKKKTFIFDQEIYRGLAVVWQKINNLSRATEISKKFLQGFKACCPESEYSFLKTVPLPSSWSFTPGEYVGSVPAIKGMQHSQIPNSIVGTVEPKVVPIAGLEGFYQPNLTALGEIRRENPLVLAEHSAEFSPEKPHKHLDLTKPSPNLDSNTQLPRNAHTGVTPWKDVRVSVVGGMEREERGAYKPAELIKGLRCTVLDVKFDPATHSGLAVLVRPDRHSVSSWIDYCRLHHEDNHRFLHKDKQECSRPLYYSFKQGYIPAYSNQELAALSGHLNPEYEATMAQLCEKRAQRDREEEEKREKRLEDDEREWIEYEKDGDRCDSPPVIQGGDTELEPEHWILSPRLKEGLGKQSIYVAMSLSLLKDYLVTLRYGSDGKVEVWMDAQKLDSEDVERETKTRMPLDQRYARNLLAVVQGEHTGKLVRVLSVGWTRSLRCQRVRVIGLKDKAGKAYQEEILPDAPFELVSNAVVVVKQTDQARRMGNKRMQTLRDLEREREGSLNSAYF